MTGSKEDLKGISTLQPACPVFHLPSYVLISHFPNFALPWKISGRAQVIGLGAFEEMQGMKASQENRFPYSQLGAITRGEVFPKKANLDIWVIPGHSSRKD